jgi:hypothetical protein
VDKYGRVVNAKRSVNLKKFYQLEENDDEEAVAESDQNDADSVVVEEDELKSDDYDSDGASTLYDPARGEGVSDSSTDDDMDDEEQLKIMRLGAADSDVEDYEPDEILARNVSAISTIA